MNDTKYLVDQVAEVRLLYASEPFQNALESKNEDYIQHGWKERNKDFQNDKFPKVQLV